MQVLLTLTLFLKTNQEKVNLNSQEQLHPPPNSLSGDIIDRINDDPWNKIILHQLPLRPIESTQWFRIYCRNKEEKLKVSGSADQYEMHQL